MRETIAAAKGAARLRRHTGIHLDISQFSVGLTHIVAAK
jgi:hypothetical protein